MVLPLWGGDRAAIGGGGIVDPGWGHRPITPPTVGFADTSPTGGGSWMHGFAASRDLSLS
jgi:hypothetical protein